MRLLRKILDAGSKAGMTSASAGITFFRGSCYPGRSRFHSGIRIILTTMLITLLLFGIVGCDKQQAKPKYKQRIVAAKKLPSSTHLYYNGTIAPIKTIAAISPADGRVAQLFFDYGGRIEKGQKLVSIDSQDLSEKFRTAISDFLTTKEALSTQTLTFQGTTALYKAGIETRNNFISGRSQYETAEMNYYQKRLALEKILKQVNIPAAQFENLTISDTKRVNAALSYKFKNIPVYAKGAGVALFPVQNQNQQSGDDSGSDRLNVGSQVKQGQLILSIGNLSGLSVSFKVGEVDINRLRTGLKVIVTGVSFPGVTLNGVVSAVASQADDSSGSRSLSQFSVTVTIPTITQAQRKVVHIGMTSKVDIEIQNPPSIMLPIAAVTEVHGQSMVTVMTKSGDKKQVPVVTGNTSMNNVTIISGVTEGQKVVVNDPI
ncbi:MAG: HlyD family efflux transporter periplasmic adaptor subunit [Coxiellaceae bacterium]|nr:HlyD family efflux transporter periplasmic adaptor subunit [Coxiellaceae bacterium]